MALRTSLDPPELVALRERILHSDLAIELYDVQSQRIVAASPLALGLGNLRDVDLDAFDIVDESPWPDRLRGLLTVLRTYEIDQMRWRVLMPAPDGETVDAVARIVRVPFAADRLLFVVRYEIAGDESLDDAWLTTLFDGAPPAVAETLDTSGTRRLADELARLRQHLVRIAREVEASGLHQLGTPPEPSEIPGLSDLSPRQWEIVMRLLRGERVPMIARGKFLSASTVRNHLAVIFRKVGVASQTELVELLLSRRDLV